MLCSWEPHAMSLIKNLKRDYDGFAIDIPSWELNDSGVTALWCPSGAGKTSVLRLLIGLEPCPGLEWHFNGEDLARLPPPARRLGVVFQTLELFPHMSARENILFAARVRDIPGREERLRELTEDLRLNACLDRKAALLSG